MAYGVYNVPITTHPPSSTFQCDHPRCRIRSAGSICAQHLFIRSDNPSVTNVAWLAVGGGLNFVAAVAQLNYTHMHEDGIDPDREYGGVDVERRGQCPNVTN
jgi:hypothetical protein